MQYQWESSEIPIYYDGTSSMPLTMEDPKPQSSDYIGLPQSLKIVRDFGQDRSIVPLFLSLSDTGRLHRSRPSRESE